MRATLKYKLKEQTFLSKNELIERIHETLTKAKIIVSNEEANKISFERNPSRFYLSGDKALDIESGEFLIEVIESKTTIVMSYHVSIMPGLFIILASAILSFFIPGGWFVLIGSIIIIFIRISIAKATCQKMLKEIVKSCS